AAEPDRSGRREPEDDERLPPRLRHRHQGVARLRRHRGRTQRALRAARDLRVSSRKPTRASVLVLGALLLFALAPHAQTPRRLALVGGMLLTGYEVPPIHHAAVLVEGNTIVQAGPASEVKIPADATIVDTSGRTMLPGLIETHGHLIVLGHGNYATWFTWINGHGGRQMLMKVMETSAKQLLMAGVTTEVDLGAPLADSLAIRDRIRKGEAVGPRVFVSGPWIAHLSAAAAGDAMQVGFGGINTSTPAEAAQQAERLAAACFDHIK